MLNCKVPLFLAYLMTIYMMASLIYFVYTRHVGTPFNDSLTEEQQKIKEDSANLRRNIFYGGVLFSTALMILIQPFQECS